jgi:cobalt-zinc-cadmium efflux system membrane fusion protein
LNGCNGIYSLVCLVAALACGCPGKGDPAAPGSGKAAGPARQVKISPAAMKRNGVKVGKAERRQLIGGLRVPAEVKLDHHATAHVTAIVTGQVRQLKAVKGQRVAKGAVMAVLHSVALGNARADIATARAGFANAKANLDRQRRLRAEGIGAEKSLLGAQTAYAQAKAMLRAARARVTIYGGGRGGGASTVVRTPIAGHVIECRANQGELVKPGEHLYIVSDLSHVWVVGRVYEQDIAAVKVGQPAVVSLAAYPGKRWTGKIGHVDATLDHKTRTLGVRVALKNPDGRLKPGLFGTISISPAQKAGRKAVVVPEGALQRIRGRQVVFVPGTPAGVFRPKPVRVGRRVDGVAEIVSGLAGGEALAISGTYTLKSELLRSELAAE